MKTKLSITFIYPNGSPFRHSQTLQFLEQDYYNILFHTVADKSLANHAQSPYFAFQVTEITDKTVTLRQLIDQDLTITIAIGKPESMDLQNLGLLSISIEEITS